MIYDCQARINNTNIIGRDPLAPIAIGSLFVLYMSHSFRVMTEEFLEVVTTIIKNAFFTKSNQKNKNRTFVKPAGVLFLRSLVPFMLLCCSMHS